MTKISVILPTYRKNCQEELDNLAKYNDYLYTGKYKNLSGISDEELRRKLEKNTLGDEFRDLYWEYVYYEELDRANHILEFTLDILFAQKFSDYEIILCHKYPEDFISHLAQYKLLEKSINKRWNKNVSFKLIKEKSSIWHSLGDYATVNNIRNTGIMNASGELLFFLDDMTIFNENLLQTVWDNYQDGFYTTCKAIKRIKIVDEKIVGTEKMDGTEGSEIQNTATWTYGMSVSLKECLKINGFDECWDGSFGGTDVDFGRRLNQVSRYKRKLGPTIYEFSHYAEQKKRKKIRDDEMLRQICGQSPIPKHVVANSWKPIEQQMEEYKVWHLANIGKLDVNWDKLLNVPLFDLKEKRISNV